MAKNRQKWICFGLFFTTSIECTGLVEHFYISVWYLFTFYTMKILKKIKITGFNFGWFSLFFCDLFLPIRFYNSKYWKNGVKMSQINVKYINLPIPSFLKRVRSKKKLAKMSSSRATVGRGGHLSIVNQSPMEWWRGQYFLNSKWTQLNSSNLLKEGKQMKE